MPYAFFHARFRQLAADETRSILIPHPGLAGVPPGAYHLLEMYCNEAGCDCRRVFLSVMSEPRNRTECVIAFGWESREFYGKWAREDDPLNLDILQGPALNPGSPQTEIAPAILDLVTQTALQDSDYVERLARHYRMYKSAIEVEGVGPASPADGPSWLRSGLGHGGGRRNHGKQIRGKEGRKGKRGKKR